MIISHRRLEQTAIQKNISKNIECRINNINP
jgi:hypothetical protein